MSMRDDFLVNLAAALAYDVLRSGGAVLLRLAVGDRQQRALEQVYAAGFRSMLGVLRQGLSAAEVGTAGDILRRFVREPDVAAALLNVALTDDEPDLAWLATRFGQVDGPDNLTGIRVNFDRSLLAFHQGLSDALMAEASAENSALANLVHTGQLKSLQAWVRQIMRLLDTPPATTPPTTPGRPVTAGYRSCFISYSTKDMHFAERLHADLQAAGVPCWFAPVDLRIGDKLRQTIQDAIRRFDKLLVVLSTHSIESPWVEAEVEQALDDERRKGLILFPIRLDEAVMETDQAWAAHIRRMRYIGDFPRWRSKQVYQTALTRLLRDLAAT